MRNLLVILVLYAFIVSCGGNKANGELTGVENRPDWVEVDPYGMVFVESGSFNMGSSEEDVPFAMTAQSKTVSIDPFWMDATEITNNEYRQFVNWVRDSIARRMLADAGIEGYLLQPEDGTDGDGSEYLNWEEEIDWASTDDAYKAALEPLFYNENDRLSRKKDFDTRKFVYEYYWFDLKQAAKKENSYQYNDDYTDGSYTGKVINEKGEEVPIENRQSFIMKDRAPVYPDTLCWVRDFTYSYNEPWASKYFWHPAFDEYPVVGVTWSQAHAFASWRTDLMNNYLRSEGSPDVDNYRLPTEAEWEYAARGGLALAPYPWGGPYTRNQQGCFIANFKPLRGNYGADGAQRSLMVASYEPNEFGLYDMAGNVSEWTSNAFDESAYSYTHDLNPDYSYRALKSDPPVLKRKVVRGGSWKDVGYYLQNATRTYEYQDTAKCYIGFRCVRSYMGRDAADWNTSSDFN